MTEHITPIMPVPHVADRKIDGSGCTNHCRCGAAFFAPYRSKTAPSGFETDAERADARERSDAMHTAHMHETMCMATFGFTPRDPANPDAGGSGWWCTLPPGHEDGHRSAFNPEDLST